MKVNIECTIQRVALVVVWETDSVLEGKLLELVKAGIASVCYRAAATKAFRGLDTAERDALTFAEKETRLITAIEAEGLVVNESKLHVRPKEIVARKEATKLYEGCKAKGTLVEAAARIRYLGAIDDAESFIEAIHAAMKNPLL